MKNIKTIAYLNIKVKYATDTLIVVVTILDYNFFYSVWYPNSQANLLPLLRES